ncbi:hypothetical protein [Clostridium fungisolvens]|uniref:DUF3784 domain-containing protein n=1 Tax=Clostridium fungisolvens TaxID=1604897 RepID=A0A6V8SJM5_9CLOT|nr:hypothetical protein [Clostridium fungisolvens]GFP75348.1 hypothetical protein bsdtw1_01422 [Clostridium fungisolvens]
MKISEYLLIIIFIINGLLAIIKGRYLGKNGTYNVVKSKYPDGTERQWAIFDGVLWIITGVLFYYIGFFALLVLIILYYIGKNILANYIFVNK